MQIKDNVALVTGASSGIGRACALALAEAGARVVASARREYRLRQLQDDHPDHIHPVAMDVRDRASVRRGFEQLPAGWAPIGILVNAAGLALGLEALQDGDPDEWDLMLDTNVKGVLHTIHHVLPGMLEAGHGHVVNIGSSAAKSAYAGGAVYCASKAAVDRITAGLRLDLLGTGVRVTAVHPSRTETEFAEVRFGDRSTAERMYAEVESLQPEDVARAVCYALEQPDHVNVSDLLVTPTDQAGHGLIAKRL